MTEIKLDRADIQDRAFGGHELARVEIKDGDKTAIAWLEVKIKNGRPTFILTTKTATKERVRKATGGFVQYG